MPIVTSALTPESRVFCLALAGFCKQYKISVRRLSDMCDDGYNRLSHSTIYRIFKATADENVVARFRPAVAPALVRFLEEKGALPEQIEAELSEIFDPQEYTKMIASRCALTPEAIRFLGMSLDPFDVDKLPGHDELFSNPALDALAARVKDAVLFQHFVAIVGTTGSGKTILKHRVAIDLANSKEKTRLIYPEFYEMEEVSVGGIATELLMELDQSVPRDKTRRVTKIKQVLSGLQQEGVSVAIMLDECHRLSDRVISSLKNFWEMTNGQSRLLGVLLFGQPGFKESTLRNPKFKEIRLRVRVFDMPSLSFQAEGGKTDLSAARAYIDHRLQLAGGDIDQLFEPAALERICANATTPLAIGNLCNEALMEAFDNDERRVSANFAFFKKLAPGTHVLNTRRSSV